MVSIHSTVQTQALNHLFIERVSTYYAALKVANGINIFVEGIDVYFRLANPCHAREYESRSVMVWVTAMASAFNVIPLLWRVIHVDPVWSGIDQWIMTFIAADML